AASAVYLRVLAAGAGVDGSFFVAAELEGLMQCTRGTVQVSFTHENGNTDFGGGNQLNVDVDIAQCLGEISGHAGVRLHASTDERDLAYLVIVEHIAPGEFFFHLGQDLHRTRTIGAWARKGDISLAVFQRRDVLQDHIDVDLSIRDGAKDLCGLTGLIRNAQDGDLCFRLIGCYTS